MERHSIWRTRSRASVILYKRVADANRFRFSRPTALSYIDLAVPNMPKISQYEIDREENIKRNNAVLESLGVTQVKVHPAKVPKPKKAAPLKKRKAEVDENDGVSAGSPPKVARITSSDEPLSGARRSARNAGKKVDYKAEQLRVIPVPISTRNKAGNAGPLGSGASGRKMCAFRLPNGTSFLKQISESNSALFLTSRLERGGKQGTKLF